MNPTTMGAEPAAQLAEEQPLLEEMDLNPVRALAPGRGVLAIDARMRVAARAG
jgi:acyl-CoA synthetase (NDP forming)